jgi:hypothetical protein
MAISLEAVGACLVGVSMIALSGVIYCLHHCLLVQPSNFAAAAFRFASHNRPDVNFYLKTFAPDASGIAPQQTTAFFVALR